MNNDTRWNLPNAARPIASVQQRHQEKLLEMSNVVGVEIGKKYIGGEETDQLCIVVLVSPKLPRDELAEEDLVPPELDGIPTDVKEGDVVRELAVDPFRVRLRPAPGGASISRVPVGGVLDVGTLGTACIARGEAQPREYYLLSCNHVLANHNFAKVGDPILQPGSLDGGTNPGDVIGTLAEWVDIKFCVPTNTGYSCDVNYVDAAIARCRIDDVNREIHWIGYPRRSQPQGTPAIAPQIGMRVQKMGRTTGYTRGEIVGLNHYHQLDILTPIGMQKAAYGHQIRTTMMSGFGDSGALVCEMNYGVAIGMVAAGSKSATLLNDIKEVESALGVRIAHA
jgi:hypothetical protein